MLNLADWAAQNPCCYISSQGSSGHCSDPASRGPIAAVTLLSGCSLGSGFYNTSPFMEPECPLFRAPHPGPKSWIWLAITRAGLLLLYAHLWVLNHNFDFYHWGSTAAVPHPILQVLNCGFVPTALELNCCYFVNVPWGQRQNLDPPSPGCAAIATCHLCPSYCCTLLSQGLCQCCVTSPSP